ncbi:hypothetical protein AOLI_G00085070 [Acnodon oligacanthus]
MGERDVKEVEVMQCEPTADVMEHDYWRPPSPGTVHAAAARMELENKIKTFTFLTDQPKMNHFCSTDEEFRFLTRFPSVEMFMLFWESVALSASRIIYWNKAQREAYETLSPLRKLPVIEECFLFICRIASRLKEQALASVFKVSFSAVSHIIITTWASYFYLVLGFQPSWMARQLPCLKNFAQRPMG